MGREEDEVKTVMGLVMTPTMEGMMLTIPFIPLVSMPYSYLLKSGSWTGRN